MAGFSVNVRGLDAMRHGLKTLGGAELPKALRTAHLEISQRIVAPIAAQEAPVGPTGRLSADVRGLATQRAARIAVGRASLPYAGPIHWGWPRHNIERNPFLQRAAELARPRVEAAYQQVVSRSLAAAGFR